MRRPRKCLLAVAVSAALGCSDRSGLAGGGDPGPDGADPGAGADVEHGDPNGGDPVTVPRFKVGFAKRDITPDHDVVMGGFFKLGSALDLTTNIARWSTGVHDPLFARAVAWEDPEGRAVVHVQLDVIGLLNVDVTPIQEAVARATGLEAQAVVVAASHSHASPDTVGIWGAGSTQESGRDPAFIAKLIEGAAAAGVAAYAAVAPVQIATAATTFADLHFNPQHKIYLDPDAVTDDTLTLIVVRDPTGALVGTVMSWPCHPMVLGTANTLISADFPGAYASAMHAALGGEHVFVNADLGATLHPQNPSHPFESEQGTAADMVRFGEALASAAAALLPATVPVAVGPVRVARATFTTPVGNQLFVWASDTGLIPIDVPKVGEPVTFGVTGYSVGAMRFATIPGELVPTIGVRLRTAIGGAPTVLVGLGNDWLGYIMTPDQYGALAYLYFKSLSAGPEIGSDLETTLTSMFATWGG
ncbi:MAG: neutral/alkaline non-lysosomal ceramidase N-terminal domain-containing protein [Deltaproteobacteria bacterium]|nr:neutral/alkaline non-lysosomal ceramidase N-terminal domain-containing protein [Deltaproteobacteria bacterium]